MILVDFSVWIDFFRGLPTPQVNWLDKNLRNEEFAVGDLILAEVLSGFNKEDKGFDEAQRVLRRLVQVTVCGEELAVEAARNSRRLRARGVTVRGTIDAVIATRCLVSGYRLLHGDRDFEPFERCSAPRSCCAVRSRAGRLGAAAADASEVVAVARGDRLRAAHAGVRHPRRAARCARRRRRPSGAGACGVPTAGRARTPDWRLAVVADAGVVPAVPARAQPVRVTSRGSRAIAPARPAQRSAQGRFASFSMEIDLPEARFRILHTKRRIGIMLLRRAFLRFCHRLCFLAVKATITKPISKIRPDGIVDQYRPLALPKPIPPPFSSATLSPRILSPTGACQFDDSATDTSGRRRLAGACRSIEGSGVTATWLAGVEADSGTAR